ncbi:GNAT family N-acetyltransferase [Niabella drilacis]|uniref:Acetyltransferase (GNAT) domain-containing protein n=1 Tax=Niabella drilacis (strain DSM 25811 / CCM 8410 / CCUG 62505 / LMG 26954 / E90) TaxID=1285928 RepID=A0A1G6JUP7_NIADE|nr:GNAT family N-acetyltransferase [Niabella drilacis]SDC21726.1 Acetyltransferase (GNAT) domain-containing protein [Niabella drilacis]
MQGPLYKQEQDLRNRILLRPIGLPDHGWEMDDHKAWHFVAVENEQVIGCVILVPLEEGQSQLKQMAVETMFQSKGIGRLLITALLRFAKKQQLAAIVCHAQDTAIPFYVKNGFEIYGEPFVEVGVPHHPMRITL